MKEEDFNNISERTDSVKVSRTSAGKYSWEIKCYYDPFKTAPVDVIEKINAIDLSCKERFKESE